MTSQRFRFLGGVVFDHAPGSNKGLVVASYWSWPSVPLYEITQFNLKLVSGSYVLDGLVYYMNNSLVGSYRTRRPFGIARRRDTGVVLVAWRGMTTSDRLMVATKTGLNAATAFTAPSLETGGIRHGVDVAFSRSTNAFVAGVTWP